MPFFGNRKFKDRDFVQTPEGLVFCLVGYLHPPERVIGFLKYNQNPQGKWGTQQRYSRVLPYYHVKFVKNSISDLKTKYPDYVWHSWVHNQSLPSIPFNKIKKTYFPEDGPKILADREHLSVLEEKALEFIDILAAESKVSKTIFGITGSILLGISNPKFSDLNITFQGKSHINRIKMTLANLIQLKSQGFNIIDPTKNEKWLQERTMNFPLDYHEFRKLRKRKWNNGSFQETFFSLTPIRSDNEIEKEYGSEEYVSITPIKLQATILDDSDASYNPAIYLIKPEKLISTPLKNVKLDSIRSIVSYEGLYATYPKPNEQVEVFGMLEKVVPQSKTETVYRVVLGTTRLGHQEYLKLI